MHNNPLLLHCTCPFHTLFPLTHQSADPFRQFMHWLCLKQIQFLLHCCCLASLLSFPANLNSSIPPFMHFPLSPLLHTSTCPLMLAPESIADIETADQWLCLFVCLFVFSLRIALDPV